MKNLEIIYGKFLKVIKRMNYDHLQILLLFVIVYEMVIRKKYKYDILMIIILGIVTFIKNKKIINLKRLKIVYFLIIVNIIILINSYFKSRGLYEFINYRETYFLSYVIKSLSFFFIITQLNLKQEKLKYINLFITLSSIYPILKIMEKGNEIGFFKGRLFGVWDHPNYIGFIFGIFFIITLTNLTSNFKKNRIITLVLLIYLIVYSFIILFLSQSRNVIIGLTISSLILLILNTKKINFKRSFCILGLFSGIFQIIICFNSRIKSLFNINQLKNDGRVLILKKAIEIVKERKSNFFGDGFGSRFGNKLNTQREQLSAFHNDYIEVFINQGILGLFFYMILVIYILIEIIKRYSMDKDNFIIKTTVCMYVYILILGLFDNMQYSYRVIELTWLFLGLTFMEKEIK